MSATLFCRDSLTEYVGSQRKPVQLSQVFPPQILTYVVRDAPHDARDAHGSWIEVPALDVEQHYQPGFFRVNHVVESLLHPGCAKRIDAYMQSDLDRAEFRVSDQTVRTSQLRRRSTPFVNPNAYMLYDSFYSTMQDGFRFEVCAQGPLEEVRHYFAHHVAPFELSLRSALQQCRFSAFSVTDTVFENFALQR